MYYILKPPNGTRAYDYWLIKEASKARRALMGVYYLPSSKRYGPVFDFSRLPPKVRNEIDMNAFEKVERSELRNAYKMICIKGCGQCCEKNAGAFFLASEAERLGVELRNKPCFEVTLVNGEVEKVCRIDTRENGQCVFYNRERRTCALGAKKPTICLLQYCTAIAERGKRKYVKVSGKEIGKGRFEMVYVEISDEEFEELSRMVRKGVNIWRAVVEILRRRRLGRVEGKHRTDGTG